MYDFDNCGGVGVGVGGGPGDKKPGCIDKGRRFILPKPIVVAVNNTTLIVKIISLRLC
jgi:hypothetical protein